MKKETVQKLSDFNISSDEEVEIIADDFDGFIDYMWSK